MGISTYLDLVTLEHGDQPKFTANLTACCQPLVDLQTVISSIMEAYDVDTAVGTQLDILGQWVGVTRFLTEPITGVYFSLDTLSVGLDYGIWQGVHDPVTGLVALPDEYYRLLIKVKILNNRWNGSINDAYVLADTIFSIFGYNIFIEDLGNLTMRLGLVGVDAPSPLLRSLLIEGKFNIKPAGVKVASYVYQSLPGPIFMFDLTSPSFGGFDTSSWATVAPN